MLKSSRLLAAPALIAAFAMSVPATAAPFQVPQAKMAQRDLSVIETANTAEGWGDRRYRRHRHRRGASAGDIIAGVLVIGGALAVASAIRNKRDDDRRDYPQPYPRRGDDDRYRSYPDRSDNYRRQGIEGAIGRCVDEVERNTRVDSVDEAERDGSGWTVSGELLDGGRFRCSIDNAGRIRDLDIDRDRSDWGADRERGDWGAAPSDRAYADRSYGSGYDDDYYSGARARQGMAVPENQQGWDRDEEIVEYEAPEQQVEVQQSDDENAWQRGQADDRYQTADGPDFASAG